MEEQHVGVGNANAREGGMEAKGGDWNALSEPGDSKVQVAPCKEHRHRLLTRE